MRGLLDKVRAALVSPNLKLCPETKTASRTTCTGTGSMDKTVYCYPAEGNLGMVWSWV